jgi:hypothetical protein
MTISQHRLDFFSLGLDRRLHLARLEKDWEGASASMFTVTKVRLPPELRRSLACMNIIENVMGAVRHVSRNVKYWRSARSW